jgi:hypothetical protein
LKGRGFSRAVSLAKSMAAFSRRRAAEYQDDFFRSASSVVPQVVENALAL